MNESLYALDGSTNSNLVNVSTSTRSDDWRLSLGHIGETGMHELSKQSLFGGKKLSNLGLCEHYVYKKHKRVRFKPNIHNIERILNYVDFDLWGSSRKTSLGGCTYLLNFIDYSRKV